MLNGLFLGIIIFMEKFVIIDGNSLINRAFYALPPLRSSDGKNYNAVYGFVNILSKLLAENTPEYLCVAFDAGRKTFRNELYAEYKATRKGMPEDLAFQLPLLKEILQKMNICILEKLGIEADDIIGTMAQKFPDVQNIIVTGDRDCLQLINQNTEVWLTKHGLSEIVVMNTETFPQEWHLQPSQIIDLKALMGDSSDNIPGVPGVGEKTALALLQEYGTVDNIYANLDKIAGKLQTKLIEGKDLCYLSYDLATIRTNTDITATKEQVRVRFPWSNEVLEIFKKYEFRSLIRRAELFKNTDTAEIQVESTNVGVEVGDLEQVLAENKANVIGFSVDKDTVQFAFDNKTNYTVDLLGFSRDLVVSKFREIFENPQNTVLVYNLKLIYKISDALNISLKAKFLDVPLAVYLINSNIKEDRPEPMLEFLDLPINHLGTGLINGWNFAKAGMESRNLTKLYDEIELPLVRVLYEMEKIGITINTKILDELEPKYKAEMETIRQKVYKLAGQDFNLNSPKQLAAILFDKLHLPDGNNRKHSTNVDVLESLRGRHPIIEEILRYRTISKLNSTYIEGMRQYIKPDGKIHTQFNQTTTVTGRLSSNEPNLQNIPIRTEEGREIRKMFVASSGCQLLSADYSQIELRLLAHYSNDPVLVEAYKTGKDIHAITAAQIFGVDLAEVTPQMRRSAKAVNFGIIYGISPFGLAQNLGISTAEAKNYIDRYFETYPTIRQFLDSSVQEYKETNRVTTLFGRIRNFDNVVPKSRDPKFSERAAMNMPLQGTASDIIKIAMLNVDKALKEKNLKAKIVLQIHDELILDVPEDEIESVKELVRDKMENVVQLRVPLPVEIDVGKSWYEI